MDKFILTSQRWRIVQVIQRRFDDLEAFAMQLESFLVREKASVQADGSIRTLFYPEQIDDCEIENYQEELRRLTDDFPQVLRSASLATIQASLEVNLLAVARFYANSAAGVFDTGIWLKEGGRIWGVKKFLEQEHGRLGATSFWQKVSDYINIRNAIAHGDGRITAELKDPEGTRTSVVRLEHVRLEDDRILLAPEAVRDFAQVSKFLCLNLLSSAH